MIYQWNKGFGRAAAIGSALLVSTALATAASAEWKPTKNIEFIVPAGTGGGADQMARMVQGIIQKHKLLDQAIVVINLSGGAGAEGFLDVVADKNNPHKIIITLSNLFTTPLATGVPFHWDDMTPVEMLALDNFILWVNADSSYQTAEEYIEAAKAATTPFKMAGTGSRQEDQIITAAIEQATGAKFTYVPYKGGGDVAAQLVGNHVDSTVNNPIEAVSQWDGGNLRPLCVFAAEPLDYDKWRDIPTCKSAGLDVEYQMLRGIFTTPGVDQDVVDFYTGLFGEMFETDEWKKFMQDGAFTQTHLVGAEFEEWLTNAAEMHKNLMTEAGFVKK